MSQKDLSAYHEKGYTGLNNLGNTCFLNACLQILNHTAAQFSTDEFSRTIETLFAEANLRRFPI
jgi:ubiquitin C-terminal hydrolase